MELIRFSTFEYERSQTILEIARHNHKRCQIRLTRWQEKNLDLPLEMTIKDFFRRYTFTTTMPVCDLMILEKQPDGTMSDIPDKVVGTCFSRSDDDIKELLTETPTYILIIFRNEDCIPISRVL